MIFGGGDRRALALFLLLAAFSAPVSLLSESLSSVKLEDSADSLSLEAYSDPARLWGRGIEGIIEEAYRECFKTYIIGGRIMNLRLPFAENNERDKLSEKPWEFLQGGKGDPASLWEAIDEALGAEDFARYVRALGDGREQVIIFDISERTWTSSQDLADLARMKAGSYRGLPHRPAVLVSGKGIGETDVYNYLYCVGWAGIDCSGFVWHILSSIARHRSLDLGRALGRALGAPRGADPSLYAGTWFYGSRSSQIIPVEDRISKLRPGDILLFRAADGTMAHSAIIQSVDFSRGVIRYLQSTDEAPLAERGVHDSYIHFDPAAPGTSLTDDTLRWTQSRRAPFPGEQSSPFSDDGRRYRAYEELGGGRVVRLRLLAGR